MVNFRISVVVDSRNAATGISAIERRLRAMERRIGNVNSLFGKLGAGLAAGLGFRAIQEQLDGYTALQNRLKAVTKEGESLAKVNEDLLQVANRSRSSLQEVGRIYSRLTSAQKSLGISQAELIDFTETLSKTIAISGATSYEAAGALTQFSQAMASSALRGDELRSIMEQLPEVSNVIAKRFGVSTGELAKLGEQGLITSKQIIAAFRDSREEIEERFGRTVPTISQAFTVLKNQVLVYSGELDRSTRFSAKFASAVIFIAKNLDRVVQTLTNLAIVLGPRYLLRAVLSLNAAIRANPFIFLLSTIATLIAIVPQFQQQFDALTASVVELINTLTGIDLSKLNFGDVISGLVFGFADAIDGVIAAVMGMWNVFVEFFYLFVTEPKTAGLLLLKGIRDGVEKILTYFFAFLSTLGDTFVKLGNVVVEVFLEVGRVIGNTLGGNLEAAQGASDRLQGALFRAARTVVDIPTVFNKAVTDIAKKGILPEVVLDNQTKAAGERMAQAFREGFEGAGTPTRDALQKLLGVTEEGALQAGLRAGMAFGTGVSLYRNQNKENIDTALFGPVRFPSMVQQNPLFAPPSKGFGARPDAPGGADVALPPQGLAANLAAAGKGPEDPYAQSLESLKAIVFTEATRITQGEVLADQLAARYDIERQSGKLTKEQVAELDRFVQLSRDAQAVSSMVQQLDVQRQYLETERQLNLVLAARPDLIAQVNQAFVANKIAALDAQTTMSAGFERAFLKLGQEAQNYASVAESAVMTFADRSTEAIATFVETGQLNFKAFASSLLSDIARLIIRLLVLQAIQAAVGLVAPGATTAGVVAAAAGGAAGGGGGRARGGTVQPDRSYVVGERGPEIFKPNTTGTIIPNPGAGAPPPQVNVQVVNVDDPKKVPQAINDGAADEAILNVLQRRRDAVRRTIS